MKRAEWLEWRRAGIGASDVAIIVGLAPEAWGSPWSLWADKVGLTPPVDEPLAADPDDFGHEFESTLVRMFKRRSGLKVAGQQTWCEHPEHPWAHATIDGHVYEAHGGDSIGVLEIKTDGVRWDWDETGIPDHYQAQAQWQMFVTGTDLAWFVVEHHRFRGRRLGVYQLARDEADIGLLFARCHEFWYEHVLPGVPPAVDATRATTAALQASWPDAQPDPPLEVDADLARMVSGWRALKGQIVVDERALAMIENAIRDRMGDHTEAHDGDGLRVSWRWSERTGIDTAAVRSAHGTEFDVKTPVRTLRYHPPKEAK